MAVRVLAVLAAICLVGAFALATLLPPDLTLAQFLAFIDHDVIVSVQDAFLNHGADWWWSRVVLPLLLRPCWLIPAACGLVCVGFALTLSGGRGAPHRRRS